ncbi:TonB-dependent receptor domain-containing protein [Ichthyobacterium seriolicida]|uniref:TonB-dependent receptor n=1 Tax=Ichthyobacterium seriolicida TaxID=242600 RepID=A0A1J1E1A9_9FLAO|nr:TonB-dependent receptor [Ichthyobacterium seriolicida]BAV94733.1 TonB-dependent receptor [Ichthyobacterium seriolicida]
MKISLGVFLAFLSFSFIYKENNKGKISGVISDTDNNPIPFVNILVKGSSIGASSDIDGKYNLYLEPGDHTLEFIYIGFSTISKKVRVESSKDIILNVVLEEDKKLLDDVVLVEKIDRDSRAILALEQKKAISLFENIGSKELSEKGISNVVEGLNKMSGVSLMGGSKVFVRGLGDRYNNVTLNTYPIPSLDPDAKVIPLDIFPTSIVENITLFKSFSPEFYGDFSGSNIDINTKDYPTEGFLKVSFGSSINTVSTFVKNFKTPSFATPNYFGFSDSNRMLNEKISNTEMYESDIEDFDVFKTKFGSANGIKPVNIKVGISGGDIYKIGEREEFAFLISSTFKNKYKYRHGEYNEYNADKNKLVDYDYDKYSYDATISTLSNLHYNYDKSHLINLNTLFINKGDLELKEYYGELDDKGLTFFRINDFKRNSIFLQQLIVNNDIDENWKLNWGGSYSFGYNYRPDRQQLVFDTEGDKTSINNLDQGSNNRFYSELTDDEYFAKLEVKYFFSHDQYLSFGYNYRGKRRNFKARQFNYDFDNFNIENLDTNDPDRDINNNNFKKGLFSYQEDRNPSNRYRVDLDNQSIYTSFIYNLTPSLTANLGLRTEYNNSNIYYKLLEDPSFVKYRNTNLSEMSFLPQLSLKYSLIKDMQLKFSFSKTISRPNFKEVVPFQFREIFGGFSVEGNKDLKNSENYNLDLKLEFFPKSAEIMTLGVFGKYFINPIERVTIASSERLFSYFNTGKAYLFGTELEFDRRLSSIFNIKALNDFYLGLNLSLMYSQISVDREKKTGKGSIIVTNLERPLQGASPYLANMDISYKKSYGNMDLSSSIVLNTFSDRIYAIGSQGAGDIYEKGFYNLNLKIKITLLKQWNLGLSVKNILNQSIEKYQRFKDEDTLIDSYKKGVTVGMSLNYNF